jgi:V/A-type H+-transporting ATPase subunit C
VNQISPSYAFATALFKAEEAKGITKVMMKDALQKSTIDDAITAMKGSAIGLHLEKNSVKTFDEANKVLQTYMDDCLDRMLKFRSPPAMRRIASMYMEKFDVFNIKIALRRLITEDEAPFIQAGTIHKEGLLGELSAAHSVEDIQSLLIRCELKAYAGIVELLVEIDSRMEAKAERDLEETYYSQLKKQLSRMDDSAVLTKALGIMIDIANLRMVVRSVLTETSARVEYYIPEGELFSPERLASLAALKTPEMVSQLEYTRHANMIRDIVKDFEAQKDIRAIERISDIYQIRSLRELLSPKVFSPAMVLALLTVKEWEIRSVRLVLKSVSDSLPIAEVANYLDM